MAYILIVLILFISVFLFFGTSNNQGNSKSTKIKDTIKEYLSKFDMYICIKNKLLLFPSKELNISNKYYTINLSTNSNLLRHRNINANAFSKDTQNCTECLHHCPLTSGEIIPLKLTFDQFRILTNDELLEHLQTILTEEQFYRLFNEEEEA